MYIVFLRFGTHRDQAGAWMAEHRQWIQQGIDDGLFLLAGSLDNAQGGVVLVASSDGDAVRARVGRDPFVVHGVVTPEVVAVTPARMADGMAGLLRRASPGASAP